MFRRIFYIALFSWITLSVCLFGFVELRAGEDSGKTMEKVFLKKLKSKKAKKIELIHDFMNRIQLKINQLKQQKDPSVEDLTYFVLMHSYLRALNLNKGFSIDLCPEKKQILKNINHPDPSKRRNEKSFIQVQNIVNHLCK